jgi:hypothetical protein
MNVAFGSAIGDGQFTDNALQAARIQSLTRAPPVSNRAAETSSGCCFIGAQSQLGGWSREARTSRLQQITR